MDAGVTVYYAPDGHAVVYWISSPEAQHSRNTAVRPGISMAIFDSAAPIGAGQAVYMKARAEMVSEADIDRCADVACLAEQRAFPVERLRPPAPLRLWRATVAEHSIHVPGSDPARCSGIDYRLAVVLS